MTSHPHPLLGFVFGEHLDATSGRSLGYRLLEPPSSQPWSAEIETLARCLQGTPYPDYWPQIDLFCSVLLASGQRLLAVARYGVTDSTANRRRGGLELIGVIGSADISPAAALQIYNWLKRRRAGCEDLPGLGGTFELADVLASLPPEEQSGAWRALPVRAWHDGCLIFAAASPFLPDQRLGLLEQAARSDWQWLPLCDGGFPFDVYAARGPLIAWTPDLMELAVRLERSPVPTAAPPSPPQRAHGWLATITLTLLLLLLSGNLWILWWFSTRLPATAPETRPMQSSAISPPPSRVTSTEDGAQAREKWAQALARVVQGGKAVGAGLPESDLLARYQTLASQDPQLRVESRQAQMLVGLVSVLGERSPEQVARLIQEEFREPKGYDPQVIRLISERIRQRLARLKE